MKNLYTQKLGVFVIFCLLFLLSFPGVAQVGIGTTNPNSNALLDIDASTTAGGLLLPRVALTGTANEAPLSAHVQGMTVYNTATAGNVTPGYYYNDGTQWVRIAEATTPSNDWTTTGNAGTTSGTNFIGTTDNNALRVRTNNANRFEFTTDGRLQSFNNGSAGQPTYSWNGDNNTGIYRIDDDVLGITTNSTERVRVGNNGNVGIGTGADASERLEVDGNLRLDGAFMPGNQAGTTDKILLSQGSGTAPTWGPGFLNTTQITNIGKYYTPAFDLLSFDSLAYTITDPNMTRDSVVSCNFVGPLPTPTGTLFYGYSLTLFADPQDGQVVFYIRNVSNRSLTNLQIQYIAYYH